MRNYIVMNEEYDRREYDRTGRVSDRYKVVCWSKNEERALPRTGYRSYGSRSRYSLLPPTTIRSYRRNIRAYRHNAIVILKMDNAIVSSR